MFIPIIPNVLSLSPGTDPILMVVVSGELIKSSYDESLSETTQLDISAGVTEHSKVNLTYGQPSWNQSR